MKFKAVSVIFLVSVLQPFVSAWGAVGHRCVGLGMQLLLPQLNMSFVNASLWPDTIKRQIGWRWTAPLHYVQTADDPPSTCSDKSPSNRANLLSAIPKFVAQLQSNPTDAMAMAMLIHLVQDVHQPLHVSGHARGGNEVSMRIGRRTWKLHEVWDSVMVEKLQELHGGERGLLLATSTCSEAELCERADVDAWARESAGLVCSNVYARMNETDEYISANMPVVLERLRLATCRCTSLMIMLYDRERCTLSTRL